MHVALPGLTSTDLTAYVDPLVRPVVVSLPEAENALPLLKEAGRLLTEVPPGDFELEDCFSTTSPTPNATE